MTIERKKFAEIIASICEEAGVTEDELPRITFIEVVTRRMLMRARRGQRTIDVGAS